MTHDEITAVRSEYAGSAKGPGKFEGESDWAAYYRDKAMEGCEDGLFQYDPDDETPISIFRVSEEDRMIFPELEDTVEVWIYEDDQGFVETRVWYIGETIPSWDDVETHTYEVVVGNIGSVLGEPTNELDARMVYNAYVDDSRNLPGCRAYKQDVTLLIDGEIVEEWTGNPGENDLEPRDSE